MKDKVNMLILEVLEELIEIRDSEDIKCISEIVNKSADKLQEALELEHLM